MGVASAITGGLTAGMGIYQTIQGNKERRNAERALENYKRQELENIAKNLAVSTLGADRQIQEQARLASTQVGALSDAGSRALIGGLGRVEVGNQNVNTEVAANLDEQQKAIDRMYAEDQARIRSMQENRENADIAALSSQVQAGKQDANMGMGNIIQGIGSVANQFGGASAKGVTDASGMPIDASSLTPTNELSTGVMTKSGGSGIGATDGRGFDANGLPIVNTPTLKTNEILRRKRLGLGYTENYDGTLNFNN